MKRKILILSIISMLVLTGFSLLSEAKIVETKDSNSLLKNELGNSKPNLYCPNIMVTNDGFSTLTLFIDVANSMYNIHILADETFDISFYFNDEDEPYDIIEDWGFSIYAPRESLQWTTIIVYQDYDEFDLIILQ